MFYKEIEKKGNGASSQMGMSMLLDSIFWHKLSNICLKRPPKILLA